MGNQEIYIGNIVTGSRQDQNLVSEGCALVVQNGTIIARGPAGQILSCYDGEIIELGENQFLAPGFVDAHVHAPQYKNGGMQLDKPLLEWLQNYTFPEVIRSTLTKGTTTAAYFGSIHKDSCLVLAQQAESQGQRAFIGKVNMDLNGMASYYKDESAQTSLNDTLEFVNQLDTFNRLTEPIITPRFALSCSMGLMKCLGQIAKHENLAIQSHINENLTEVEVARQMFPDSEDYFGIYEDAGLFGKRALFAHSIHTTDSEYIRMAETGTSVIHCPDSNIQLMSGFFNAPVVESN